MIPLLVASPSEAKAVMPTGVVPTVAFLSDGIGRGIGVADRRDVELVGVVDGDGVALGGDRAVGGGGTDGDRLGRAGLPVRWRPPPSRRPSCC